ncbi:retrotransposon protein, putative, ty1-copia subclass [Tanacetum coccineum]
MVRSMMSQTTLPKSFWDYALETAARILNMVPTKKVDKTPYEIWHGQAPKLSYLKVWGCEALVKRDTLTKLDPRSFRCIFVGYPKETIGYSFYNPSENKVFVARNAEFFENDLIDLKASGSVEDLELIQEEDTNPSVDTSLNHEEDDQEIDEPQSDINPIHNDVWVLVELPPNARTVGSKWLFKKKTDKLVQTSEAIRLLKPIAAYYDYEIWQMDVKTAFLNGHLSEEVYMEQPEGFVNPKYPNHPISTESGEETWTAVKIVLSILAILKVMFMVYGGNMKRCSEFLAGGYTVAGFLTDAVKLK